MAKTIIKATKSPLFIIIAGLVIVAGAILLLTPSDSEAGVGAIWTTQNDCGDFNQDLNHYNVDEWVYINGSGFEPDTNYNWNITGRPGKASADPNTIVASGGPVTTDEGGDFTCFPAYQIPTDNWGEYTVTFGSKHDNYRVGETGSITIKKG